MQLILWQQQETTTHLCCIWEGKPRPWKALVWVPELPAGVASWTSRLLRGPPFPLERTADKLRWFRREYLTAIFWKTKEASLSLQEKQVIAFDPSDEIQAFGWQLEFWETCIQHYEIGFSLLTFLMRSVVILMNVIFFHIISWNVPTFGSPA